MATCLSAPALSTGVLLQPCLQSWTMLCAQGDYSEGQSMLEVARMLLVQVRSVLSAEQEQHRLLLAEKQRHKATAEDSSSSEAGGPAAAADGEPDLEVETAAAAMRALETAVEELEDTVVCIQGATSQVISVPGCSSGCGSYW